MTHIWLRVKGVTAPDGAASLASTIQGIGLMQGSHSSRTETVWRATAGCALAVALGLPLAAINPAGINPAGAAATGTNGGSAPW